MKYLLPLVLCIAASGCGPGVAPGTKTPKDTLEVTFSPEKPVVHLRSTREVNSEQRHDHSEFGIELTNRHVEPIVVKKVTFEIIGDENEPISGVPIITSYWPWPEAGDKRLEPDESIKFSRVWSFKYDTGSRTQTFHFKFVYARASNEDAPITLKKQLVLEPVDD